MNIQLFEQGTDLWHAWRADKKTASNAPIIMGCAPSYWKTRKWDDLRAAKAGIKPDVDDYTQRMFDLGHKVEALARETMNNKYGVEFKPLCVEADHDFAASLDGYHMVSADASGQVASATPEFIEVKMAMRGEESSLLKHIREFSGELEFRKRVPAYIWWQLVHQAYCVRGSNHNSRTSFMALVVADKSGDILIEHRIPLAVLLADVDALLEKWAAFESGQDHAWDKTNFNEFASEWIRAKREYDLARADLANCKDKLESIMRPQESVSGGGIDIKYFDNAGAVDWQALARGLFDALHAAAQNIKPVTFEEVSEQHRKPRIKGWRIAKEK